MTIIDTPFNTSKKIACLTAQGVSTVIRYYNFSNSQKLPEKRMELAEAQALSTAGLQIAAVFQQQQDNAADFSLQKGLAAGARAFRYAHDNIGQPGNSGIYFSVDFDANLTEIKGNIQAYFTGVKQAFQAESGGANSYRIGAYGSGLTCSTLADAGLIDLIWISQSSGFQGSKAALAKGQYNLHQRFPAATLCGLGVDLNDVNPSHPDFGQFSITHQESNPFVTNNSKQYKVIARSSLNLREGPGPQFDVIGALQAGQLVFVDSITDGWAHVDLEGDGQLDGFSSAAFLKAI